MNEFEDATTYRLVFNEIKVSGWKGEEEGERARRDGKGEGERRKGSERSKGKIGRERKGERAMREGHLVLVSKTHKSSSQRQEKRRQCQVGNEREC